MWHVSQAEDARQQLINMHVSCKDFETGRSVIAFQILLYSKVVAVESNIMAFRKFSILFPF